MRSFWTAAAAVSLVLALPASPARADSPHTVALWAMNEPAGSQIMYDSSGNGLNGTIGSEVGTATWVDGAYGYRFARLQPDTPPTHPQHLAVVPANDDLNPGTRDFSVTLRLRTTEQFGNIIQKGQATVPGGSYKLQIPSGKVQCWFRGSEGALLVTAPRAINDGRWHTVRCTRITDAVYLEIDGTWVAGRWGRTGSISNTWPLSIGGKPSCDQITVGCDYFAGDLDYAEIDATGHNW
jgi:hypothetical protein